MKEAPTVLHKQHTQPTSRSMERKAGRHPFVRIALMAVGVCLWLLIPIIGPIPGPGGVFLFAGGLVLFLQNSEWARKKFIHAKRRWPRFGHYADMALRRRSFRRRQQRAKEAAADRAEAEMLGFPQESN